jgi:hypothetical protein
MSSIPYTAQVHLDGLIHDLGNQALTLIWKSWQLLQWHDAEFVQDDDTIQAPTGAGEMDRSLTELHGTQD